MRNRHTGPEAAKSRSQKRRGIATVELLIALPLITAAFATLMFIAHASNQKNGDYQRLYLTGMSRHTLQPPEFDSTQTTHLEKTELNQTGNLVSRAFPATEMWDATVSQPLRFVPGNFQQDDWNTTNFSGALYKGTGSPEYRTESMISPPEDRVKALAISAVADSLGNKLGINLSQANRFLELLTALAGSALKGLPLEVQNIQVGDLLATQQDATAAFNKLENELNSKLNEFNELKAKRDELTKYRDSIDSESDDIDTAIIKEITRLDGQIHTLRNEIEFLTPVKNEAESNLGFSIELFSKIHKALKNLGKSEN